MNDQNNKPEPGGTDMIPGSAFGNAPTAFERAATELLKNNKPDATIARIADEPSMIEELTGDEPDVLGAGIGEPAVGEGPTHLVGGEGSHPTSNLPSASARAVAGTIDESPEASDDAVRHFLSDTLSVPEILSVLARPGTVTEVESNGRSAKVKLSLGSPGRFAYGHGVTIAEACFDALVQTGVKAPL